MCRALTLAALLCVSAASIRAQGANTKTVYVPNADTSSSFPQDDQKLNKRLADAAVVFLEVRLNSLKDLHVERSKSPCATRAGIPESVQGQVQPTESRTQSPPLGSNLADSYEVKTTIRTLGVSALNENEKELVLDYQLVKYVSCIPTTLVHRSEPISEKTAFGDFLQMGNMLEVKLRNELAPPKINIDVADISSQSESLQPVRDDLINQLFIRLARESEFRVRDIRRSQQSPDADYVVTGVLTKDRVQFTIRNVKDNSKNQSASVLADQKNIQAFYKTAAETVVNYIRVCPTAQLTEGQIADALRQVSDLLCKNKADCKPDPTNVTAAIFQLTRLNCTNKTSVTLTLLGDAYVLSEDFLKAAEAYDQAVKLLSPDRTDKIVETTSLAGDAWYQAQNYGNAAQRYELAIAKSPELQPPAEAVYIQRARSYRFGSDKQAFTAALDGLNKYTTSDQLAEEVSLAFNILPPSQLPAAYDLVLKSNNLDALPKVLPKIQERFAGYLLEEAYDKIFEKNINEVDRLLKMVETLPPASIPQQFQDAHKIIRAIWQRDAKNDFQNAVTVLHRFRNRLRKLVSSQNIFWLTPITKELGGPTVKPITKNP
ncbi:MAG TPA: hypothetical protein VFM05_04610 [Candidatus Saccharimonadales bacterium]|nr:hypothetical protein [Candidatus Saccharimonadales bacterium]